MTRAKPGKAPSQTIDIGRVIKEGHERILALFQVYLGSPADGRQPVVDQLLHQLALQLELEEGLLFSEIRRSGPDAWKLVEDAQLKHEEVKSMIYTLNQSEADDDQAWDEFFEDMMQSVRILFMIEERDLVPFVDRSLDA